MMRNASVERGDKEQPFPLSALTLQFDASILAGTKIMIITLLWKQNADPNYHKHVALYGLCD